MQPKQNHYREENSTFTHMGYEFDLNFFLEKAENLPVQKIERKELEWLLDGSEDYGSERVVNANLNYPLLVTRLSDGKLTTIDGWHRFLKACVLKNKNLDIKLVPKEWFYDKKAFAKGKVSPPNSWKW